MADVNPPRRYNSAARKRQAEQSRLTVLDEARRQFLAHGYAATSVGSIAREVGVAAETVYKAFGPKAGLVRALWLRGLEGAGPVPAEQRSDALTGTATEAADVLRGWARLATEVAPHVAPIHLLVREAASADRDMADLLDTIDIARRERMHHNAKRLADRGWLRAGVTVSIATDVLLLYTSPEVYEQLILKSQWSVQAYGTFIAEAMIAALL